MKKLLTTVILSFVLIINLYPQSGWQIQSTPAGPWFSTVYFLNENTGWIARYEYLLKTTNKGINWTIISNNFDIGVTDIQFMDELTGHAVGSSGCIKKTTNGGLNWFFANCPECYSSDDFLQIQFVNGNTGYAYGDMQIFKSTNAGLDWSLLECNLIIHRGQFLNALTGWVVGLGAFAKTTNGGVNWVQNQFTNNWTNDVFFINFNTGWIVSTKGDIFKTTNGGNNWTLQYKDSTKIFNDVVFTSNDTGWAIGQKGYTGYGFVLKTTNSGMNWFNQQVPNIEYYEIFMLNSNEGWIAGGNLLHTTNGGGTIGINQITSEIPSAFSLSQNYPNPFNPSTKIRFQIPSTGMSFPNAPVGNPNNNGVGFVTLKVYDVSGKEVATLVNEHLQPGTYETDWNASSFSSGVYFYKLSTGNYSETRKMILMK
jgi:photosystem II stability/assembly factor-like uncharacterized protein